jgi:hypothetical protein
MKTAAFSQSSDSEVFKVSSGTETINQSILKNSTMDGQMSVQTMSMTMSGRGIEGGVGDLIMQNFEQMSSGDMATMDQLNMEVSSENALKGMLNSEIVVDENFSMNMSMTMNEQEALMLQETEEQTNIERIDNFVTETKTDAFQSEIGFISAFDN